MKVGDLVYMPYFGEYGIIVSKYDREMWNVNAYKPDWIVVQWCGYCSQEYEEDLEVISESR